MTNKKCLMLTADEFRDVLAKLYGDSVYADFSLDGLYVGLTEDDIPVEDLHEKLAKYFRVHSIDSIHLDDDEPCNVWLVYTAPDTFSIPLESGKKLVAESGTATGYRELYVYLKDEQGVCMQDLVLVSEKYHYDPDTSDPVPEKGLYSVKVYADKDQEDWTNAFTIEEWEGRYDI